MASLLANISAAPGMTEAQRDAAADLMADIARLTAFTRQGHLRGGLAGGHAGIALFHAYLHMAEVQIDDLDHRTIAETHLEVATDELPDLATFAGFYSGFPGVAWAVEFLRNQGFLSPEEDLNEEMDLEILEHLHAPRRPWLCELIAGLSGIGLYGLERRQRGRGRDIVEAVIQALADTGEWQGDRLTWFNGPDSLPPVALKHQPEGAYNLGLSHGVPGAVAFLAEAAAAGHEAARPLAEASCQWLLDQARDYANGSHFGYTLEPGRACALGSRVAWCYGDLGVSSALLRAARHLGRKDHETRALALLRDLPPRTVEDAGMNDTGLCHGAFGNAHILHRLYRATGETSFLDGAVRYFQKGMEMRMPGREPLGFPAFHPPQEGETRTDPWEAEFGFLEGIAGIGMAMLTLLHPIDPAWDRILLVDIPGLEK